MNLGELISKLLPITEQLISPGGVEGRLAQDRFKKRISLIFVVAGAVLQFIIASFKGLDSLKNLPTYLANFIDFVSLLLRGIVSLLLHVNWNLALRQWDLALRQYEIVVDLAGLFILLAGLLVWLFFAARSAYRQYSEEPFKYTFWVEPFKHVEDTEKEKIKIEPEDRFHYLLHHDLAERLNNRITRLFLLNPEKLDDSAKKNLSSHIHIEGHYTLREKKDGEWVIHVMPSVRIGSATNPSTLSEPIKFKIEDNEIYGIESKLVNISSNKFKQIIERVYSSVATEIYKQIECDLKEKIKLFPTEYLRAVALYNEAEDFARSNTVDAYEKAIDLYKKALRYFNVTKIKPITNLFLKLPLLWRRKVKFVHMKAKAQIGYAKCLIYRREISALSGRDKNPLFGIRSELDEVINNLLLLHNRINRKWKLGSPWWKRILYSINKKWKLSEKKEQNRLQNIMAFLTFPKDSWGRKILRRPNQSLFERQNRLLFDAYLVSAYTYRMLGAVKKAEEHLDNAKAVDPQLSEQSALYHLVAGTIEPNVDKALLLFRQAAELAPYFQMAKYLLAYYSEIKFRIQDEISKDRVKSVIDEYEEVLDINPGNIAALAAQGYLYWLSKDLKNAKKKFEEGCDVKAILQQTYIGELNYGLAKIAAEEGDFNESYDKYNEAISADPGVGAYSLTAGRYNITPFYDYIGFNMLKRYKKFKEKVEMQINNKRDNLINRVYSYVLNDYGNACLNYYHDTDKKEYLIKCIKAFEQSIELCPENRIVSYNLSNAYEWNLETEKSIECLREANKLEWHVATIAFAQARLSRREKELKVIDDEKKKKQNELNEEERKLKGKTIPATLKTPSAPRGGTPQPQQVPVPPKPDKKSEELKSKIENLKTEIKELSEREKELTYNYNEVIKVIRSIIEKTKISPIYTGYGFNKDGQGVDNFLSERDKIKKHKFNESDIEALRVWAELLSNNDNKNAQKQSEKLYEYIEEYYPENFDVHLSLHNMNMRIIKDKINQLFKNKEKKDEMERDIQKHRKRVLEHRNIIKAIIDYWDKEGIRRYATSRWRESFSEEDPFISVILDVLREEDYLKIKKEDKEEEDTKKFSESFNDKLNNLSILIYKSSISSFDFSEDEFKDKSEIKKLCEAIDKDNYNIQLTQKIKTIEWLNEVLMAADLYEKITKKTKDMNLSERLTNLKKDYDILKTEECLKRVNRSLLEKFYPQETPKSQATKEQAKLFNGVGDLFFNDVRYKEAIPYYEMAIEHDNQPIYSCSLGRIYENLELWRNMIEYCEYAVKLRREKKKQERADLYELDYYYEFLAKGYFKDNRLAEFEGLFEKSGDFKDEPIKKAIIYNKIGNLLAWNKQNIEAIPYYEKAIEFDRQRPIYQCNLGLTYSKLTTPDGKPKPDSDKMIEHCSKAVELRRDTPTDPYELDYYYEFLAEGYFKAGKLKEFEEIFEKSEDFTDEPEKKARIYNRIGNLFYDAYRDNDAISYYKKATELDPEVAVYYANLGGAYKALPQWKDVEQSYLKAIKFDPKNAGYHNTLANLYWEIQNWEKAINEYTKAFELDNQPIYSCNLGRAYGNSEEKDKWDKMIKHCSKAVELRRDTPTDPYELDYYYEFLAEAYFKDNRLPDFEKFFEESGDLKDEPEKKAIIYNKIKKLYLEIQNFEKKIKEYKEAFELDNQPISLCNLGRTYGNLGQWDKMIEHCSKAVELRRDIPTDPYELDYYYEFLAEGYFKAGRLAEFEKLFEESGDLANEPTKKAIIYNKIGNLYAWNNQNIEAIPYYEQAIEFDRQRPIYECNLGLTHSKLPKPNWDKMIEHCQRAVELRREILTDAFGLEYYYGYLAEGYFNGRRLEEFEKLFEKSGDLKNEPDKKAIVYNQIGNFFFNTRKERESIPYYKRATELAPNVAVYHANLGGSYRALGQLDEAIKKYELAIEKAIKINPDDKTFHKYLSLVYNDRGIELDNKQEYDKAIEDYKKAIELNNNDPVIYHNLYLAYFTKGMYKEAREAINKALALSPDNQTFSQALNTLMSKGI